MTFGIPFSLFFFSQLNMSGTTLKPRSMTAGARNVLRSNDSASLWNCTLSPGWTEEESEILRKALMKFGIGNWAKIIESGCLPGKTNAQMNLQLQRLLGQQSTAGKMTNERIYTIFKLRISDRVCGITY